MIFQGSCNLFLSPFNFLLLPKMEHSDRNNRTYENLKFEIFPANKILYKVFQSLPAQAETRLNNFVTVLLVFSLTVKAATLIFISECGSAISSAKEGKSGLLYNLVKS